MPVADMSLKSILALCFPILLLGDGVAKAETLRGIVGESVTFQVKTDVPYVSISWSKFVKHKPENVAVVTFGEPCGLQVALPALVKRVWVFEDCRGLKINRLEQGDRGLYYAAIVLPTGQIKHESFELEVDRHLLDYEMRVTCTPDGAGNGNWKLNCSTGDWKDKAQFSWKSPIYRPSRSPDYPVIKVTSQDLNVNVTCMAENRISEASKTVFLKDVCSGASGAEKLNSFVGLFAIFEVKTNLAFDSISWSKIVGSKSENIAVVTFGKPCGLLVPFPAYKTRVKVSEDCRELEFDQLEKGDAGRYTAKIIAQNKMVAEEPFYLRVSRVAKADYLRGIVGESITFPVKANLSFVSVSWRKLIEYNPENIAVMTFGEPCGLQVPLPALENRVRASKDCRGFQLSRLEQDDRGLYYADFFLPTGEMKHESFELEVDRHLQDYEMRVICTPVGTGNGIWQLNCSTGDWKDRVEFSWESPIYRPTRRPDDAVIEVTSQDLNVSVTCRAENGISQASRTVFLKDVCSGASGAEKLNGYRGSFAIFEVKTSLAFDSISWSKVVGSKSENIALVTFRKPCGLLVPLPSYETRVKVSEDCRELELNQLEKGDAGRYTAKIIAQNKMVAEEPFYLRVFRVTKKKYLNDIVGESVTFQLKTNRSFDSISWYRLSNSQLTKIATVTFGEPCGLDVRDTRLKVSKDCRGLQLNGLRQDDRGYYYPFIYSSNRRTEIEAWELAVERHLLDSEMRVTCIPDRAGNGNWKLNCSTGDWKDKAEFSWESPIYRTSRSSNDSVIKVTSQDLNVKVTCRAENMFSKASKTVFLKDVCSGDSGAEKLNSFVGSLAIFKVKTNLSFHSISWSRVVGSKSENFAVVTFGKPCGLLVSHPTYKTQVKVSEDCKELELNELEKGDAGRYNAEIIAQNKTVAVESFYLRVSSIATTESLTGIVGRSVTFQVKTNLSIVSISWSKRVKYNSENISVVTFGDPCGLQVPLPALEKRVRVSKDCRGLKLSHLEQDDRGLYYAEILLPTGEMEYEPFELAVERHLLDSEMRVTCTPGRAAYGKWKLNCSTGDWKDRVEFSWESPIYRPTHRPDDAVIKVTSQDLNVKVTCRAENQISEASKTVFLKDVCSGQAKNLSRLPLWALLCLGLGGSLLLSGCMELIPIEKPRKADGGGRRRAQPHPRDD